MTNDPAASAKRPVAVCDACILYSITMADLLTSLGETGLYHPKWTRDIHEDDSGRSTKGDVTCRFQHQPFYPSSITP